MGHAGRSGGGTAGRSSRHVSPSRGWGIEGSRPSEFRIAALVTSLDVLYIASRSLAELARAGLVQANGALPDDAWMALAAQAAGPRLALAVACILAVRVGSTAALTALATVAVLVQGFDAAVGAVQGNAAMTIVPILLAMAQGYAIVLLDLARARGERLRTPGSAPSSVRRTARR